MYDTKFTMNHSRSNVRYNVETVIGSWGKSIDSTEKSAFKISIIWKWFVNPSSLTIHIQILQTDLYIFP